MIRPTDKKNLLRIVLYAAVALNFTLPTQSLAATSVALAKGPLASSTTADVLPNLMFVLDTSGSMGSKYLPDWANDSKCLNTDGNFSRSCVNAPPYRSSDFNGVYYNPAIRYFPPVDYKGTSYPSQTSWTAVADNAFVTGSATTDLVTTYTDTEWCESTDTSFTNCLRNGNYVLPGTVAGKAYTTPHAVSSTGSGKVVNGIAGAYTIETRDFGPHYYIMNTMEYCDSSSLKNCQTKEEGAFTYPAKLRWCDTTANAALTTPAANVCQKINTSSFNKPRYSMGTRGTAAAAEVPAVPEVLGSVTLDLKLVDTTKCTSTKTVGIASIIIGSTPAINLMPTKTGEVFTTATLVSAVTANIVPSGGYVVSFSGSKLTITAPTLTPGTNVTLARLTGGKTSTNCKYTAGTSAKAFSGYKAEVPAVPEVKYSAGFGSFTRVDILEGQNYSKVSARSDCTTTVGKCTGAEELTNFANWWTYYQTRMQTMKTSVSRAFKSIDNRYRVGFINIYGSGYVPVATFDGGVTGSTKDTWYTALFGATPSSGTPLRTALSRVGKIFAGLKPATTPSSTADPMQYSCQQNFTLLTTDGYWNTDADSDITGLTGDAIGDQDGGSTPYPQNEGATASSNSLADVAKYYYSTDLRQTSTDPLKLDNCIGSKSGIDVCENNVFTSDVDKNVTQHMTTFTLGLGVDGRLEYQSDYKIAKTGDYARLVSRDSPVVNWPVPKADSETAIDDLWHAAVNGGGTYFSAKDPNELSSGLNKALASIKATLGAGAAAATSTLNPVSGDNSAFLASYTTVKWQGNLENRPIDLVTGELSPDATWCVEDVVATDCASDEVASTDTSTSPVKHICTKADKSFYEVATSCTGTMAAKVSASSDSRTIYIADATGKLVDFNTGSQLGTFDPKLLSQYSSLDSVLQQPLVTADNLVLFLRGQSKYEDRISNPADNRVFRERGAVTGDFIESTPAFVGRPTFSYTDKDYAAFKTAQKDRAKNVYIGGNDGMLHAYNADDGVERWAFIPRAVIPNLWKLADKNYSSIHTSFVNGGPVIGDVYVSGAWHTIMVVGLNAGGREFFALDITDPEKPKLLWEIDSTTDDDIGYSYGQAVITKTAATTDPWVVLLTSGYNNTLPGSGEGVLFVRDAYTGAEVSKISNKSGDATATLPAGGHPSGLAKIATWTDNPQTNSLASYTYGGDLNGDLWRFDINAKKVTKFATLTAPDGTTQPITTEPTLASIESNRIVYVGTGKYLEVSDLTDTQVQTIYAIKDDDTSDFAKPRDSLVEQVLTETGTTRTVKALNPVDFKTGRGWFIDLIDKGERVNVNPLLDSGNLFVPTTVPSNVVCAPGGYSWFNYFDFRNGTNGKNPDGSIATTGSKTDAPIVGIFVTINKDNHSSVSGVLANSKVRKLLDEPSTGSGYQGKRVIWRELIPQ